MLPNAMGYFYIPKLGVGWNIYLWSEVYNYNGISFGIYAKDLEVLVGLANRITKAWGQVDI